MRKTKIPRKLKGGVAFYVQHSSPQSEGMIGLIPLWLALQIAHTFILNM